MDGKSIKPVALLSLKMASAFAFAVLAFIFAINLYLELPEANMGVVLRTVGRIEEYGAALLGAFAGFWLLLFIALHAAKRRSEPMYNDAPARNSAAAIAGLFFLVSYLLLALSLNAAIIIAVAFVVDAVVTMGLYLALWRLLHRSSSRSGDMKKRNLPRKIAAVVAVVAFLYVAVSSAIIRGYMWQLNAIIAAPFCLIGFFLLWALLALAFRLFRRINRKETQEEGGIDP